MAADDPRHRWADYVWALFSTLCWGLSFVGVRVALEALTPYGLVWTRLAIGAAVLYALLAVRGGPLLPERGDRARCTLLGLLAGAHLLVQSVAMELTTAIRAGWIVAFIPAVVAVGARLFLRERLPLSGWAGVAVATVGVLLLSSFRPGELTEAGLGDLLMISSCFTWAAYTLLSVGAVRRSGALRVNAFALAVALVPNLAAGLVAGTATAALTLRTGGALVFLGALASGLAFLTFGRSVALIGAQRTSAFQYLQPFVTLGGSVLLLGEPFTAMALVGGALVLIGVWRIQRARIAGR